MDKSHASDRLYFTAYLYSEYILRNIEDSKPDLLERVIAIKKSIHDYINKVYIDVANEFSIDILMDAILEYECFHNSNNYDCELFSGAILKRLMSRKEYNKQFEECIEEVLNEILRDESVFPQFQELVRVSLDDGIYMTHLDSFRNEGYSLTIPKPLPKESYLRHIFFKNEKSFWKNAKHISYNVPEYSIFNENALLTEWERRSKCSIFLEDKETYLKEEKLKGELAIYFPIFDDYFNINTCLSQAKSIIIASRLDYLEHLIDNYKKYHDFVELFFNKDIHRVSEDEMENKILGLLIWDGMRSSKSISEAIEFISKKYNSRLFNNQYCTEPICTKKCISSCSCNALAQKLYNVAKESIKNKRITTSKELKQVAMRAGSGQV